MRSWFRVELRGAENLPTTGPALLVSNHAGAFPLDGMVLHTVVFDEIGRHPRMLGADLIFRTPFSADLARKTGTTLACPEDAERLLRAGELVVRLPRGLQGPGQAVRRPLQAAALRPRRLRLDGRADARSRSSRSRSSAPRRSTRSSGGCPRWPGRSGWPYFPLTPTFPWLGPLGAVPLPSKWVIEVGEAIATDELPPGAADDPMVVFDVTDQVRETIQQTLYALLLQRRGTFF